MSAVTANLKYVIWRKRMWPLYAFVALFLVFFVFVSAHAKHDSKLIGICIAYNLLISANFGGIVASWLIETLTKPVTFTLPNHRTMVRMVLFMMEGLVLLVSLIVLVSSGLSGRKVVHTGLILMAVSSLGYWGAVLLAFAWRRPLGFLFLSLPLLIFLTVRLFHAFDTVQRVLIQYQIAVIPLAVAVNLLAWRLLRDSERLRDFIRRRTLGQFSLWWRTRYYDSSDLWDKQITPAQTRQDRFFLERMRASSQSGIARCIWGEIYEGGHLYWFTVSVMIFVFVMVFIFSVILGYLDFLTRNLWYLLVFFCPMNYIKLTVYSTILLCLGRRERFVVTLVAATLSTLKMIEFFSGAVLLTIPLSWVMPTIHTGNYVIPFHAVPVLFCYFPLFFAPQGLAWSLLFRGKEIARLPTMCLNVAGMYLTLNGYGMLFILGSWVFLILVSYWISKKWSLVRP